MSGKVNPSGKLPFSFPKKLSENAAHFYGELSYPGNGETQYYKEDILVGYRWHDTKKIKPEFAFGHGLSYASFQFSEIISDKKTYNLNDTIKISCNLSNVGKINGSEVVQVYIGKENSRVERALKELKGFKKVLVQKASTKKVEISIPVSDLAYYDETISDWNIEKGYYKIYIGNSSVNIFKILEIKIM